MECDLGGSVPTRWAQGRVQNNMDPGSFSLRRDYRNLFGAHPDNTFLIKASYWFSM